MCFALSLSLTQSYIRQAGTHVPSCAPHLVGIISTSTCQVYIIETPLPLKQGTEEEYDLIDMAWEPRENSRLGCQIHIPDAPGKVLKLEIPASAIRRD